MPTHFEHEQEMSAIVFISRYNFGKVDSQQIEKIITLLHEFEKTIYRCFATS